MSDIVASISNGINILGNVLASSVRGALSNSAAGCNNCDLDLFGASTPPNTSPPPTIVNHFNRDDRSVWLRADWSNDQNVFANTWRERSVSFAGGNMILSFSGDWCPTMCDQRQYRSGEYRTREDNFGEGDYRFVLKAARGSGIITAFSIYQEDPHDEVIAEFPGKNCSVLQTNYFVNNQGHHEKLITLPFDACADFHEYTISWQADSIVWSADRRELYRVEGEGLPSHPGNIIMNLWGINNHNQQLVDWAGLLEPENLPIEASFGEVEFSPAQ